MLEGLLISFYICLGVAGFAALILLIAGCILFIGDLMDSGKWVTAILCGFLLMFVCVATVTVPCVMVNQHDRQEKINAERE